MRAKTSKSQSKELVYEISRGNVLADLGLPNPEERLTKAMLAIEIAELIENLGLNQVQAAARLGIDQPKISNLLRGRLRGFSTDRLMAFLNALDCDVIITIRPAKKNQAAGVRVLVGA